MNRLEWFRPPIGGERGGWADFMTRSDSPLGFSLQGCEGITQPRSLEEALGTLCVNHTTGGGVAVGGYSTSAWRDGVCLYLGLTSEDNVGAAFWSLGVEFRFRSGADAELARVREELAQQTRKWEAATLALADCNLRCDALAEQVRTLQAARAEKGKEA
jgi:hypothetical protein